MYTSPEVCAISAEILTHFDIMISWFGHPCITGPTLEVGTGTATQSHWLNSPIRLLFMPQEYIKSVEKIVVIFPPQIFFVTRNHLPLFIVLHLLPRPGVISKCPPNINL